MNTSSVNIIGIETQVRDTTTSDGFCSKLKNLIPSGPNKQVPFWKVIETGDYTAEGYPFDISKHFSNPYETYIVGAYYQKRKTKNVGSAKVDLNRWVLIVLDNQDETLQLFVTKVESGKHVIDGDPLCSFKYSLWKDSFDVKWEKINVSDVALNVYDEDESHLFFIIGDSVYNGHIHQKNNNYAIKSGPSSFTLEDYPNGDYPGYIAYTNDRYVSFIICYRIKSTGLYIKHSTPFILKLDKSTTTLYHFIVNRIDLDAVLGGKYKARLLLDNENVDIIDSSPYIAITPGFSSREEALNTPLYYVVGNLESFNTGSSYEIKMNESSVALADPLNIDPLSHHIIGGQAIGNYRNNLLLGDSMLDFALPGTEWFKSVPGENTLINHDPTHIFSKYFYDGVTKNLREDHVSASADSGDSIDTDVINNLISSESDLVVFIEMEILSGIIQVDAKINQSQKQYATLSQSESGWYKYKITIPKEDIPSESATVSLVLIATQNNTDFKIRSVVATQSEANLRDEYDIVEVTIGTPQGDIKRYQDIKLYADATGTKTLFPEILSYPDRNAKKIKFYRTLDDVYFGMISLDLKQHPSLNCSYVDAQNIEIVDDDFVRGLDQDDNLLNVNIATENKRRLREPNKFRATNLNEYEFPLERVYSDAKGKIVAFIDNTQDIGEGQFGQFPLFILCENSIHGAESTGGLFVSRIETVTSDYGVISSEAYVVFQSKLWFASKDGLHVLIGSSIEDIHYPIREYGQASFMKELLKHGEMFVGAHEPTQEVLFTDGRSYLFAYSTEFNRWYEAEVDDYYDNDDRKKIISVDNRLYFLKDYRDSNGLEDEFLASWRSGSSEVDVSLITTPITFGSYSVLKKTGRIVLVGKIKAGQAGLTVTLQGMKTGPGVWKDLCVKKYTVGQEVVNAYMRSNFGSQNAYRLKIEGDAHPDMYIQEVVFEYNNRIRVTR